MAIDTTNYALVTVDGSDHVRVQNPWHLVRMTKQQALAVAAWLIVMTGIDGEELADALRAVQNT
jgi:hypothetical protein